MANTTLITNTMTTTTQPSSFIHSPNVMVLSGLSEVKDSTVSTFFVTELILISSLGLMTSSGLEGVTFALGSTAVPSAFAFSSAM